MPAAQMAEHPATATRSHHGRAIALPYNRSMRTIMRTRLTALAMLLIPTVVLAQDPAQIQRLFESGKYQQVVDSTTPDSPPDVIHTTAQSQQKLGAADQAAQTFGRLAERPEADPWHFVGLSGRQLVEGNIDAAIASARQAAAMAPDLPAAQYQL